MKRLLPLVLVCLCVSAQAQAPDQTSFPLIVHVYSDGGTPVFDVEGEFGSNGPLVSAGGVVVVRASGDVHALVIVGPYGSVAGTVGPNAVMATAGSPAALQTPRPGEEARSPAYHQVSVLTCASFAPRLDENDPFERPVCVTWQALRMASAPEGPTGFTLEVNYGIGVYSPAPASAPDPPTGGPIDPRRN